MHAACRGAYYSSSARTARSTCHRSLLTTFDATRCSGEEHDCCDLRRCGHRQSVPATVAATAAAAPSVAAAPVLPHLSLVAVLQAQAQAGVSHLSLARTLHPIFAARLRRAGSQWWTMSRKR